MVSAGPSSHATDVYIPVRRLVWCRVGSPGLIVALATMGGMPRFVWLRYVLCRP